MRVLVTGSRDWQGVHRVWRALSDLHQVTAADEPFVVVHGHCPKGVDAVADQWCREMVRVSNPNYATVVAERWPADWATHGRRAGYVRNAKMVELGADVCLAFIRNNSPGASMTARLAEQKGIPLFAHLEN